MPNHRYRCYKNGCFKRVTLPKRKELYVKEPVCKKCGGHLTSAEKERRNHTKKTTCNCDGIGHPHRRGCKWCNHYTGEYDEHDLAERNLR